MLSTQELEAICEEATVEIFERVRTGLSREEVDALREIYNQGETDFDEDMAAVSHGQYKMLVACTTGWGSDEVYRGIVADIQTPDFSGFIVRSGSTDDDGNGYEFYADKGYNEIVNTLRSGEDFMIAWDGEGDGYYQLERRDEF